jgi:hypothetical protein
MNTSRMDTVLIRQKRNLVVDALFAMVVIAGVLFYLFGLGATQVVLASAPAAEAAPMVEVESMASVEHNTLCSYEPTDWRC